MDIGEIKCSIQIKNSKMVMTLSEQERMKLIRRLAVSGKAHISEEGNMEVHFDLGGVTSRNIVEEEEAVEEEPKSIPKQEDPKQYQWWIEGVGVEEEVDYKSLVDTEDSTDRRSIDDLTSEEKEFLVDLYISDIPTTVIMESENVTKSALYSSLERERIPRKGKLNTIIRRLEDEDSILDISNEEDIAIDVINRIISVLQ